MTDTEPPRRRRLNLSAVRLEISPLELWAIRASGAAIFAVLAWIGIQVHAGLLHIAEIRTELSITKPAEVLQAVRELERRALDAADVESILRRTAPWIDDKPEWRRWRETIDQKITALETQRRTSRDPPS